MPIETDFDNRDWNLATQLHCSSQYRGEIVCFSSKNQPLTIRSQNQGSLLLGIHHVTSTGFSSLGELINASTTRLQASIESFVLKQSPPREQLSHPGDTTITATSTPQVQAGSQNGDSGANGVESSQIFGIVASVRQRCRQDCICQCHLRKLAPRVEAFCPKLLASCSSTTAASLFGIHGLATTSIVKTRGEKTRLCFTTSFQSGCYTALSLSLPRGEALPAKGRHCISESRG